MLMQRMRVPSVASPASTFVPPGPASSPTGVHSASNQGPCNGPSCAGGPGQRHSWTDVCPSPECSMSGTAPPVPSAACPMSVCPYSIVVFAAWNAAPCPPPPPSPDPSRYSPPSYFPPAPWCQRWSHPPPSAPRLVASALSPLPPSPLSLRPRGDVCPDDVPPSLPRHHLENHHVGPTPLHRLHYVEDLCLSILIKHHKWSNMSVIFFYHFKMGKNCLFVKY